MSATPHWRRNKHKSQAARGCGAARSECHTRIYRGDGVRSGVYKRAAASATGLDLADGGQASAGARAQHVAERSERDDVHDGEAGGVDCVTRVRACASASARAFGDACSSGRGAHLRDSARCAPARHSRPTRRAAAARRGAARIRTAEADRLATLVGVRERALARDRARGAALSGGEAVAAREHRPRDAVAHDNVHGRADVLALAPALRGRRRWRRGAHAARCAWSVCA